MQEIWGAIVGRFHLRGGQVSGTVKKSILENRGMVKLQQLQGGQLIVSIPQALAVALDLKKGDEVVWRLDGSRLYMERVE